MSARFITFEGIDGAGKSSHINAVAAYLRQQGATLVLTREPGGTPLAERLRELLLHSPMDHLTESLLVFAARRDHVQNVIAPALARGDVVLCDRFTDATFAYQGGGRGFDPQLLSKLENWVHADVQPDLTLWFDLPAEVASERRAAARTPDRFEQQDTAFFERVRSAYAQRAAADSGRIVRVDAAPDRATVAQQVLKILQAAGW